MKSFIQKYDFILISVLFEIFNTSIQNIHSVQLFGRSLFPVMYILFQIECIKDFKNVPQNCMCIFITIYLNA